MKVKSVSFVGITKWRFFVKMFAEIEQRVNRSIDI